MTDECLVLTTSAENRFHLLASHIRLLREFEDGPPGIIRFALYIDGIHFHVEISEKSAMVVRNWMEKQGVKP